MRDLACWAATIPPSNTPHPRYLQTPVAAAVLRTPVPSYTGARWLPRQAEKSILLDADAASPPSRPVGVGGSVREQGRIDWIAAQRTEAQECVPLRPAASP